MSDSKYLRVTEILYPFSGLGSIDPAVLQNAANRGTKAHQACEAYIQGFGDWIVDPEVSGYLDSFKSWWGSGHKVIEMEKRFYDDELGITGQVDLILETENGLAVVDLKTPSSPSKTWLLQGSAYSYMAKKSGYEIKDIIFIKLDKTGKKYKLYQYQEDIELFKQTLNVYNYFFRRKTSGIESHSEV